MVPCVNSAEDLIASSVAETLDRELNEDWVELWKISWHVRRSLPNATDGTVRAISEVVLADLLRGDAVLGDVDSATGTFSPWSADGALDLAMAAWGSLGRDPRMGDIGWLARLS